LIQPKEESPSAERLVGFLFMGIEFIGLLGSLGYWVRWVYWVIKNKRARQPFGQRAHLFYIVNSSTALLQHLDLTT